MTLLASLLPTLAALLPLSPAAAAVPAESLAAPDAPRQSRLRLATGVELRVLERGARAGEPVLLLHGYTDTARSFLGTMEALAELRPDLRLVAPDLRGHGGSSLPPEDPCRSAPGACFEPAALAEDALALLDALAIERAHVVGHSLGSLAAQELALAHPERVRRIALLGSTASLAESPLPDWMLGVLVEGPWRERVLAAGKRFPEDAFELTPLEVDPGAADWLAANWVIEPAARPELLAEILEDTCRTPIATWLGVPHAVRDYDQRERLRELRVPALVLWATQDSMFLAEPDQADLREALAAAGRRWGTTSYWKAYGARPLPQDGSQGDDLGHNFQWAAAEAVAADLAAFLREGGRPTDELVHARDDGRPGVVRVPGGATVLELPERMRAGRAD